MKLKKYKAQGNNDVAGKLKSYSALTGAFLLSAGAAHGQVIFTDINPDTLIQNSSFDIDFDHDGIRDFGLQHYTSTYYHAERRVNLLQGVDPANRPMAALATFMWWSDYSPLNLPAGNPIGPGGPFYSFAYTAFNTKMLMAKQWKQQGIGSQFYWTGRGPFLDSAGFIGVEFHSNGNTYYGWIECAVDDTAGSVTIKGFAYYDVPNHYIIAGSGNPTGIEETSAISDVSSFYPNPASNGRTRICISSKQAASLSLEVMNGIGQVFINEDRSLNAGKNIIELDVRSLAAGTYFVRFTEGEKAYFRKILVSK